MTFRVDLDYHAHKADREAETSGSHFVEFYDHGEPSKTGLLCVPHRMWTVGVGDQYFSAPVEALRLWCYRRWTQPRGPTVGGDDRAFWGVLFPLSRFGLLARERLTAEDRAWVRLQTERMLVMRPPAPAMNLALFGPDDLEPKDEEDDA